MYVALPQGVSADPRASLRTLKRLCIRKPLRDEEGDQPPPPFLFVNPGHESKNRDGGAVRCQPYSYWGGTSQSPPKNVAERGEQTKSRSAMCSRGRILARVSASPFHALFYVFRCFPRRSTTRNMLYELGGNEPRQAAPRAKLQAPDATSASSAAAPPIWQQQRLSAIGKVGAKCRGRRPDVVPGLLANSTQQCWCAPAHRAGARGLDGGRATGVRGRGHTQS